MAAATDQTYRNQKALDYVFAASCVALLLTTVWMFVQDYFREFKSVQRDFRDVEEAMAQRGVLENAPDAQKLQEVLDAEMLAQFRLNVVKANNQKELDELVVLKIKGTNHFQGIKIGRAHV